MGEDLISIESDLKDFRIYLEANSRCILSAKFGNGKSYFISKFIEKNSKDYLFIPIYPVNYQVMDNKDIFELIKRDILIRLLSSEEININEVDINTASLFYYFFMNNRGDQASDILSLIPDISVCGVDINIGNVISKLKKIKQKFDKYKEQFEPTDKTSETFVTHFKDLKGSIYEFDTISQLICDIILNFKKEKANKEVVLIIEDLDRIDPAHIFRILNVFSAHFDRYTPGIEEFEKTCGSNKFCLDKIVTVCDFDNIRNIYSHVYGEKTDFIGYISKFSNSRPYEFSLKDRLESYIIDSLLEKDLLRYPLICKELSKNIILSMDNHGTVESNLRIIKERISKANSLIKLKSIELTEGLEGKHLLIENCGFVKLLSLLKSFNINASLFYGGDSKRSNELYSMLGGLWALSMLFEKKIKFIADKDDIRICCYEDSDRKWYSCPNLSNCFKGNELVDIDFSAWNEDSVPVVLMRSRIRNIVNHITDRVII
ncbi:P-loop NTPase fold protein [Bacteroides reticulotermitis]|uniref:P-loop NTPase fold protein n=1 Tax=Bacteroides reticulotermitis TaxID=1133319 RepID=UPI003A8A853D